MLFKSMRSSPEFNNVVVVIGHKLMKLAVDNNISAVPLISHPLETLVSLKHQIVCDYPVSGSL